MGNNSNGYSRTNYESACKRIIKAVREIKDLSLIAKDKEDHDKINFLLNKLNNEMKEVKASFNNKLYNTVLSSKINQFNKYFNQGVSLLDADMIRLCKTYNIYTDSKISEFSKMVKIFNIYPTSKDFVKDYIELVPCFVENDINFLETLLSIEDTMINYEKTSEVQKVYDENKLEKYACYDNLEYARFIVKEYINSDYLDIASFVTTYNTNTYVFNYCVNVLNELDVDLYKEYEMISEVKKQTKIEKEKEAINKIYFGIVNGYYLDNNNSIIEFNDIEFFALLPFRDNGNFYITLKRYLKKYGVENEKYDVIVKYVVNRGLSNYSLNDNEENLNSILLASDIEVSVFERNLVKAYMRHRNLPLNSLMFLNVLNEFRNYRLNLTIIDEEDYQNKEYNTIIPSSNKRVK